MSCHVYSVLLVTNMGFGGGFCWQGILKYVCTLRLVEIKEIFRVQDS
jgi:hypothetical protein